MIPSTGSDSLDDYRKQIINLGKFDEEFSKRLSKYFKNLDLGYTLEPVQRGFKVNFHGLTASFSYRANGYLVGIKNELNNVSREYGLSDEGLVFKEERMTMPVDSSEFGVIVKDIINPALEEKLRLFILDNV